MNPEEFRSRFIAKVRSIFADMPNLADRQAEFLSFDSASLIEFGIHPDDVSFLVAAGLPKQAAPFLNFTAYSREELRDLYDLYDMPSNLFPLGCTGSGDPLGIELSSRAIIYLNHDDQNRRVFINSTLERFSESLCLYQEARSEGTLDSFLDRLSVFDAACAQNDSMWPFEIACELE